MKTNNLVNTLGYWNDVAHFQVNISKEEEDAILREYQNLKKAIYFTILGSPVMLEKLIDYYLLLASNNKSIAKLSRRFNSNIPGLNTTLSKEVSEIFIKAMACTSKGTAIAELTRLDFSVDLFEYLIVELDKEKEKTPFLVGEETSYALNKYQNRMYEIEDRMVRSCLMGAIKIVGKYSGKLFNIDKKDAIQYANMGILSAVKKYNPDHTTKDNKKARFFTYAFWWADKKIQEYIMENSRLVRLPRSKLNVVFLVIEAARSLPEDRQDVYNITDEVNKVAKKRNKKNKDYTTNSINEAIELLHGSCIIPLDSPPDEGRTGVNLGNRSGRTIKDIIPDGEDSVEDKLIRKQLIATVIAKIRPLLTHVEFRVLMLRFLGDTGLTMEETKVALYEERTTSKKLCRERISQIERRAISKIKHVPNLKRLLSK